MKNASCPSQTIHTTCYKTASFKESYQIRGPFGPKGASDQKVALDKKFFKFYFMVKMLYANFLSGDHWGCHSLWPSASNQKVA